MNDLDVKIGTNSVYCEPREGRSPPFFTERVGPIFGEIFRHQKIKPTVIWLCVLTPVNCTTRHQLPYHLYAVIAYVISLRARHRKRMKRPITCTLAS